MSFGRPKKSGNYCAEYLSTNNACIFKYVCKNKQTYFGHTCLDLLASVFAQNRKTKAKQRKVAAKPKKKQDTQTITATMKHQEASDGLHMCSQWKKISERRWKRERERAQTECKNYAAFSISFIRLLTLPPLLLCFDVGKRNVIYEVSKARVGKQRSVLMNSAKRKARRKRNCNNNTSEATGKWSNSKNCFILFVLYTYTHTYVQKQMERERGTKINSMMH